MPKRWEKLEAKLGPERQASAHRRAEELLLEMDLREFGSRRAAPRSGVGERRKDTRLATLRR